MRDVLAAVAVLSACGSNAAGLEVIVEADLEVANRSSRVAFEVRTQEGEVALQETFNIEQTPFPIRRLVAPRGGDASRVVTITAQAVNANGETLTTARIIRSFVEGRTPQIRLRLYELCLGTNCLEGLTCEPINGRAECVDARVIEGTADAGVDSDAPGVCSTGQQLCDDKCVDFESDEAHCGQCGRVCSSEQVCSNGTCEIISCDGPAGCSAGNYCNMNTGRCLPGCDEPTDCGDNASCDMSSNQCECATGYHPCSSACLPNNAVTSCGDRCGPCEGLSNGTASCQPSGDSFVCAATCNDGFNLCNGSCALASSPTSCGPNCTVCSLVANATQMGCNGISCTVTTCIDGYQPSSNGQSCEDIDECLDGNGGCDVDATCSNTPAGRRTCTCNPGFTGDGLMCGSTATWRPVTTTGPSARYGHAIVYDSALNRVVLFGGNAEDSAYLGDTWVLSGGTWSEITGPGPSARTNHAMVYDSTLNRVVLFGGDAFRGLSDTWVLSGSSWRQITAPGPSARAGHAMAYDSVLNRVVLFGGRHVSTLADTWVLSGDSWSQITDPGPSRRSEHALVYDSVLNRVVLFGGRGDRDFGDTWVLSGSTWREITVPGPTPRYVHAMTYDSALSRVVLFGGAYVRTLGDTWVLSGSTWREITVPGPTPRYDHAMTYDSALSRVVLFGGAHGGVRSDTLVFQ